MPKTHCRFLFAVLLVIVTGLALGMWLLWPRPGITAANTAKIQDGMTRAEIEAILGGPPGYYRTPDGPIRDYVFHFMYPGGSELKDWHGDEGLALVAFDQQGRVVAFRFLQASDGDESLLEKFRCWLRL